LTRIWRDWLAERAKRLCSSSEDGAEADDEEYSKRLQWSSLDEHIGLRLRVIERDDIPAPIIRARYEDPNVGYTLQYEGMSISLLVVTWLIYSRIGCESSTAATYG